MIPPSWVFAALAVAILLGSYSVTQEAEVEVMGQKRLEANVKKLVINSNKGTNLRKKAEEMKKKIIADFQKDTDYPEARTKKTQTNLRKEYDNTLASTKENDLDFNKIVRDVENTQTEVGDARAKVLVGMSPMSSEFLLESRNLFTSSTLILDLPGAAMVTIGTKMAHHFANQFPRDHAVVRAICKVGVDVFSRVLHALALVEHDTTTQPSLHTSIAEKSWAAYMKVTIYLFFVAIFLVCALLLFNTGLVGSHQFLVRFLMDNVLNLPLLFFQLLDAGATMSSLGRSGIAVGVIPLLVANLRQTVFGSIPWCVYAAVNEHFEDLGLGLQFLLTFVMLRLMRALISLRVAWPSALVTTLSKQPADIIDCSILLGIHLVNLYVIKVSLQLVGALLLQFSPGVPIVRCGEVALEYVNVMPFPVKASATMFVKMGSETLCRVRTQIYIKAWESGKVTFKYEHALTKFITTQLADRAKNRVKNIFASRLGVLPAALDSVFGSTNESIHCELSTTGFFGTEFRIELDQAVIDLMIGDITQVISQVCDRFGAEEMMECGANKIEKAVLELGAQAGNVAVELGAQASISFLDMFAKKTAPTDSTKASPVPNSTKGETEEGFTTRQAFQEDPLPGATSTTKTTSTTTHK